MAHATTSEGYVIVSGPPGSGKSTLAAPLADELALPLLSKDTIKQALMSVLPVENVEASRNLGRAAVAALLAVAEEARCGVLDSVWHPARSLNRLRALPGPKVEVFCRCERAVAAERFTARSSGRSAGHFDSQRSHDELWNDQVAQPVNGGWRVLEIDAAVQIDVLTLADDVRAALCSSNRP